MTHDRWLFMKILCVGDIFGRAGRQVFDQVIDDLRREYEVDLVVANGENAAAGAGITSKIADQLFDAGVDVMTLGDHTWDKRDIYVYLDESGKPIIRPANFPEGAPGQGMVLHDTAKGKVAVLNLLGRTFMKYNVDCPFKMFDQLYERIANNVNVIVVDFHCETTSEKNAFGWYVDGRASVVFGTHTHIQTADEKILKQGTAYITDVGMTGPYDSVIGSTKEAIIQRFVTSLPCKFEAALNQAVLHGVVVEVDDQTGLAHSIERIQRSS